MGAKDLRGGWRVISGTDGTVVGDWEMLGVVIRQVEDTFVPVNEEVAVVRAVLDPKVPHSHCLGSAQPNGAIGDASSSGVIGLNGGRTLREPEFVKSNANRFSFATIVEQSAEFGLSRRGNNLLEFMRDDKNRTVQGRRRFTGDGCDGWIARPATEKEVTGIPGTRVSFTKIRCITVNPQIHVTSMIANNGIGMCGSIVEKLDNAFDGRLGGGSLF